MTIGELRKILLRFDDDTEVRIGDQIEAGPYSHASVGGVFRSQPAPNGKATHVILCANDDEPWIEEPEVQAVPTP